MPRWRCIKCGLVVCIFVPPAGYICERCGGVSFERLPD